MSSKPQFEDVGMPAGGWGSVKAVAGALWQQRVPIADAALLLKQNKPGGFACVSCAWAKPAHPHPAEFCENGAKATAWELTSRHLSDDFFLQHTLTTLRKWSDHELEDAGRLMTPMRWDATTDTYQPVEWQQAFDEIGRELKAMAPEAVVFYASGRASLEASYLYQLMARVYGTNNLPDSSNMCHETTSVALPETIGVPVGTVTLDDFEHTDAIFFFGQNVGTNSPRMLHLLKAARDRGVPIVTFNPLRERGLVSFTNPQSPTEMLTGGETAISTQYHQVKVGGDIAALMGICKAVLVLDDQALRDGGTRVIDTAFIAEHGHGFEAFAQSVRDCAWSDIERESGLAQRDLEEAAAVFARAKAVMAVYGMGLTQHREGVQNVQMLTNLLLMGGHIGRRGAGICPVRGHSNVQGQRTVGITEKPELAPLDQLEKQYGFTAPRKKGLATVEACEHLLAGKLQAFIGLGGNFVRAVPETAAVEQAWSGMRLTVQVATKLNRSHLVHGEVAYLLPCLGRIEIDRQASGEQTVSVEDSTGWMHGSRGVAAPAGPLLLSEIDIVARLAEATLAPSPHLPWREWAGDYRRIREAMAVTFPQIFHDYEQRLQEPAGFPKPNAARERVWNTPTKKATFIVPTTLVVNPDNPEGEDILRLTTIRSDDQFNTTVYGLDDRFRGIYGTRKVLLANRDDMARLGLEEGALVTAVAAYEDGVSRRVQGLRVTPYDIPAGCVAGYFPECNPLMPLSHHAISSLVPAAKSIAIRMVRDDGAGSRAEAH